MRLIAQIPHPRLQISIFKSDLKFILKFEAGPFEQVYKFMESERYCDADSIRALLTQDLLKDVFTIFDQMNQNYQNING
ncbi:MAG: hypothetical protein K1X68_10285 [Saprospiraceae bacterium]|nr:hypothetical protein [Saprospiraceae bacterium]HMW39120.1 hypothetical protein [Saprospiraceae bacterium]HMX89602.1 hypothetical protein [Saprospiraceae bacterium]HMZ41115.1 hypothetical protein [Saprospiraceae bacterium]HNA65534.1 hypothetical protein [Saprospiraceae bacterium]